MNKDELRRMLDTTFELEGLLQLAINRADEGENPDLERLIWQKAAMLCPEMPEERPAATDIDMVQSDAYELQEEEEEAAAETPEQNPEELADIADASIFEEREDASATPEPLPEPPAVEKLSERRPLKALFTLNDRFRFRNQLFNGSEANFEASLRLIDSLDALYEAEDYLYNDLQLDPDSPDVQAFLAIVDKHFQQ